MMGMVDSVGRRSLDAGKESRGIGSAHASIAICQQKLSGSTLPLFHLACAKHACGALWANGRAART